MLQGTIEQKSLNHTSYYVYLPPDYSHSRQYPVLYFNDGDTVFHQLSQWKSEEPTTNFIPFILVGIVPENRTSQYTPWPARAMDPRFPDFGGNSSSFLEFITTQLKPLIDQSYSTRPEPSYTGIAGISLSGLFALYTAYHSELFGHIISISGSFWYENWISYIETKQPVVTNPNILLIVGETEGRGKQNILKDAVLFAEKTSSVLSTYTPHLTFHKMPGGHHDHRRDRLEQAFLWFSSQFSQ